MVLIVHQEKKITGEMCLSGCLRYDKIEKYEWSRFGFRVRIVRGAECPLII